jgi:hypothetical protein
VIRFVPEIVVLILWIYCIVDVISSPEGDIRNLGKGLWVIIVLFFPLVGSIAWLVAGRPVDVRPMTRSEGAATGFPEYERRGRFAATDPEKDEEFLKQVRARAEQQRKRYEAQQRAEREARERKDEDPAG